MERFTLIKTMEKEAFPIKEMCAMLEVSRSGYYAHSGKQKSQRQREDVDLTLRISEAFSVSRQTYGSRRLRVVLGRQGRPCSRRRIARLMKINSFCARRKGRFKPRTTDSRHHHPIAPNRLLTEGNGCLPPAANQTWVADITYLPTGEGWLYLAAEMNLGTRRIVGWKTGPTLESTLVEGAFNRAIFLSGQAPKVHHSDRGSQYAAQSFRSLLNSHNVCPSMSRRANCYPAAAGLQWNPSGLPSKQNAFMPEPLPLVLRPINSYSITSNLFITPAVSIVLSTTELHSTTKNLKNLLTTF